MQKTVGRLQRREVFAGETLVRLQQESEIV